MKLHRSQLSRTAEIRDDHGKIVISLAWGCHKAADAIIIAIDKCLRDERPVKKGAPANG
jgi:hypothetical protein